MTYEELVEAMLQAALPKERRSGGKMMPKKEGLL
jgi:hypothetical protein